MGLVRCDADKEKHVERNVKDNIVVARAVTSEHQDKLLEEATVLMVHHRFSIIIVDSVISLFGSDYSGRSELAERQQKLAKFLRKLLILADSFGVAVVLTNQVVADPNCQFGDPNKAAGGNIVAHATTTRVSLGKSK